MKQYSDDLMKFTHSTDKLLKDINTQIEKHNVQPNLFMPRIDYIIDGYNVLIKNISHEAGTEKKKEREAMISSFVLQQNLKEAIEGKKILEDLKTTMLMAMKENRASNHMRTQADLLKFQKKLGEMNGSKQ